MTIATRYIHNINVGEVDEEHTLNLALMATLARRKSDQDAKAGKCYIVLEKKVYRKTAGASEVEA